MKKQSSPKVSTGNDEPYNNYMKAYRVARARMKSPRKEASSIEASFGSPLKKTISETSTRARSEDTSSKKLSRGTSDSDSSDVDSIDFEIKSIGDVAIKEMQPRRAAGRRRIQMSASRFGTTPDDMVGQDEKSVTESEYVEVSRANQELSSTLNSLQKLSREQHLAGNAKPMEVSETAARKPAAGTSKEDDLQEQDVMVEADVGLKGRGMFSPIDAKGEKNPFSPGYESHASENGTDRAARSRTNLSFQDAKDGIRSELKLMHEQLSLADEERSSNDDSLRVGQHLSKVKSQMNSSIPDAEDRHAEGQVLSPISTHSPAWSSKKEKLKAELQKYTAQLRMAKNARKHRENEDIARIEHERTSDEVSSAQINMEVVKDEDPYSFIGSDKENMEEGAADLEVSNKDHKIARQQEHLKQEIHQQLESLERLEGETKKSATKYDQSASFAGVFGMSEPNAMVESTNKVSVRSSSFGNVEDKSMEIAGDAPPEHAQPVCCGFLAAYSKLPNSGISFDWRDTKAGAKNRLLLSFSYVFVFVAILVLFALLCFIFGLFTPWGFPTWAITLPSLGFGFFYVKAQPRHVRGEYTLPGPVQAFWMFCSWITAMTFIATVLSANAARSIQPLLSSSYCNGNKVLTNYTSTTGVSSTYHSSSDLLNLAVCESWNMCNGNGIKMASCGGMYGMNVFNTLFFLFSFFAFFFCLTYLYYIVNVRHREYLEALHNKATTYDDLTLGACWERFKQSDFFLFITGDTSAFEKESTESEQEEHDRGHQQLEIVTHEHIGMGDSRNSARSSRVIDPKLQSPAENMC